MEGILLVAESILVKVEHKVSEDDAEGTDEWNELLVKEEQEEDEYPLPASFTLHSVKEKENEPSPAEEPLQMVKCGEASAGEEQQLVPSKEEASNKEGANDTAELPQDEVTTQSASGSRRPAKKLDEHAERCFKCNLCGSSFSQSGNLTVHMRTHTGERPYKCEVCDSSFSQNSNLVRHMRKHTGEMPYKCDQCGKSFSLKQTLVRHMRTHTGDRPYICDVCETSCSRQSQLVSHMRKHTSENLQKSDVCGKSFSHKQILVRHMRNHAGERLFKCDVCGTSYSQQSHLVSHMRKHTGSYSVEQLLEILEGSSEPDTPNYGK